MEGMIQVSATDSVNSIDWLAVGMLVEEKTRSCPHDCFGWNHPKNCKDICRCYTNDLAIDCWKTFFEGMTANKVI